MALTDAQREALLSEALERGLNPTQFIADAEAESDSDDESDEPEGKPSGPNGKGDVGFYAFQHPYMTVNEIRESMGLPSIPDGGAFSGDWLAKHGGAAKGTTDNGE